MSRRAIERGVVAALAATALATAVSASEGEGVAEAEVPAGEVLEAEAEMPAEMPTGEAQEAEAEMPTEEPAAEAQEAEAEVPAEEAAQAEAEPEAAQATAEASDGWVERATFTTGVLEREPQDAITSLTNDSEEIYFFTDLREFGGETVTHRWSFGGEVMAEVPLDVGGARWRTYSRKRLEPAMLGEWTVAVVDRSGRVVTTHSFTYAEAATPEPPAPTAQELDPADAGEAQEAEAPESDPSPPASLE